MGGVMGSLRLGAAMAGCVLLAACGGAGGGGGVGALPAPPTGGTGGGSPTPTPAPVNTFITDLKASQTFTSDATTTDVEVRTAGGIVNRTAVSGAGIQVSYDAAAGSYTVTTAGRSQTFAAADRRPDRFPGEATFAKTGGDPEYLTLVTVPLYDAGNSNRYVGLGYWQRNAVAGGVQATQFTTFAYGLTTAAGAVPRSGSAAWATDIFGLLTTPGEELRTVQGRGDFNVDFGGGIFTAFANLDEFDFITGGGRMGSLRFRAGGQVGGTGNGFSGNMSYSSGRAGTLGGTISGQFYGPGAEEIGASFKASGNGTVLNGALTGQRTTPATGLPNLSLVNVQSTERLFTTGAGTFTQAREGQPGYSQVNAMPSDSRVTITPTGPSSIEVGSATYRPVEADRVADGRLNYTTYRGQVAGSDGGPVEVAFYRPGGTNSEIALTYLSFATWTRTVQDAAQGQRIANTTRQFVLYGIQTPRELLSGRTGTGSYAGIVAGAGANRLGDTYTIGGTSRFDVDFGAASYTGSLSLVGTAADGARRDFGSFGFGNRLIEGVMVQASLDGGRNADSFNIIKPAFYGPDGQEIGASFYLTAGNPMDAAAVAIGGITVAKRQ